VLIPKSALAKPRLRAFPFRPLSQIQADCCTGLPLCAPVWISHSLGDGERLTYPFNHPGRSPNSRHRVHAYAHQQPVQQTTKHRHREQPALRFASPNAHNASKPQIQFPFALPATAPKRLPSPTVQKETSNLIHFVEPI
jgi:hypothetical protein